MLTEIQCCSGPSINCQKLKVLTDKTPRKVTLCARLQQEKEARLKAEKSVLTLTNQLTEYNTVEKFLTSCENHLSSDVLTTVKSHKMSKTRNPHSYRYTNDMKLFCVNYIFLRLSCI